MTFKERLSKGLDPLTGEKMQTVGVISIYHPVTKITKPNTCWDETGREVTLNEKGTWIYKS
jgi:hypothetical protein